MKKLIQISPILVALFVVGAMVACKDKGPHLNPEVKVEATLDGTQEVPRVTTSASGRMEGIYNKDTKTLTFTVNYSGLTPIAGHFHQANRNENGPVIFPYVSLTNPISGTWTLNQQQENWLIAGVLYANLHTALNRNGEIRGQIVTSGLVGLK